jgi:hypothetical protein
VNTKAIEASDDAREKGREIRVNKKDEEND